MFRKWLKEENPKPYNSYGNGSAMRVSPIGCAFNTRETTLIVAEESAGVSHNHPEGIKGAKTVARLIHDIRTRGPVDKDFIAQDFKEKFCFLTIIPIELQKK